VAEIGINHNGDPEIAKALISLAAQAGCQAVKFQKRTVDVVYTPAELAKSRESPFGTTNGDLKRGLELGQTEYAKIDLHCREVGMDWFASPWDEASVDFLEQFSPPCYKIASACITDLRLIARCCATGRPLIMSCGMSNYAEVDVAVDLVRCHGNELLLLHTVSTYPAREADLNLRMISTLRERYNVPVGYSGHEVGLSTTVVAVALGACCVERHITLDRSMFGSDQAASVEPEGLRRLVRYIRTVEAALGDGIKRVLPDEIPIRDKLRRVVA
jgi:N-acetylneuraminate synthase